MPSASNRDPACFIKSGGKLETCNNLGWCHDWTPIYTLTTDTPTAITKAGSSASAPWPDQQEIDSVSGALRPLVVVSSGESPRRFSFQACHARPCCAGRDAVLLCDQGVGSAFREC